MPPLIFEQSCPGRRAGAQFPVPVDHRNEIPARRLGAVPPKLPEVSVLAPCATKRGSRSKSSPSTPNSTRWVPAP